LEENEMSPRTTAPVRRKARSFRLGEDTPAIGRRFLPAVLAFVIAAVVFGFGGYLIGRPDSVTRAADDIRAADAARDKQQILSLTTLARDTADTLGPVIKGLGTPGAPAADVAGWQQTVDAAAKKFDDPPSGATATNVARGSLAGAIDQLALAVSTYTAQPDLSARQRDLAVTAWSVGATQLDQVNVDAGYGHQHVYLESDPGSEAFTPDDAPEGQK
jgi:hypothetical protein